MGLDMYLEASMYIGGNWDHKDVKGRIDISSNGKPIIQTDDMSIVSEIVFHVADWRKANAIHKWFVEECQGGIDECQKQYVSRDKLKELLDLCKKAKGTADPSLLPPTGGFFFGSTEVDQWYWQNIDYTIDILTEALDNELYEECSFTYQSSW